MLFFGVTTEQDKTRQEVCLFSTTGRDIGLACLSSIICLANEIEYKPNLFAYATLPRHLSGWDIVVILAKFIILLQVLKSYQP